MTWQVALVLTASALVLLGAALVRGTAPPRHGGAWPWVAGTMALALAAAVGPAGRVHCCDVDGGRLARLAHRAARAGVAGAVALELPAEAAPGFANFNRPEDLAG